VQEDCKQKECRQKGGNSGVLQMVQRTILYIDSTALQGCQNFYHFGFSWIFLQLFLL
jgi:hypothetical protein